MSMSTPSMSRSPRPTSATSYQSSSPRLSSPLNPSPSSSSPLLPGGHTPRNSPVGEMSDTLSPLRERLDSGLTSPAARLRTSSFSRSPRSGTSPERSPAVGSMPLQSQRVYARQQSPGSSPFSQGIPFPSSSPRSSSPLAGASQSPMSHSPRPCSSPRQGSPASIHSTSSQFQPFRSPPLPTQPSLSQSSPIHIIPSPSSRYPRTQSLIQQSLGNPFTTQMASSPDNGRKRRVSLGAELRPHSSPHQSPTLTSHPLVQDPSVAIKGESTPLNEAPIRWWGGRRGWDDDWDSAVQQSYVCDSRTGHHSEYDGGTGTGFARSGPLISREPFGRGVGGPGAFLDEEIRASIDGIGGMGTGLAGQPDIVHAPMGANAGCEIDGIPRAVLMPIAPGSTRSIRSDGHEYGEVNFGPPPVEGRFATQKVPDLPTRRQSCHVHFYAKASGFMPDGAMAVHGQEPGYSGYKHVGGRSRRCSDVSTHSSTSYASCVSGPSQSQSQSLFASSSQSHPSSPSLYSLGIGLEEAEREGLRSRTFWARKNSVSTMKRQSKVLSQGTVGRSEDVGSVSNGGIHMGVLEGERAEEGRAGEAVERTDADSKKSGASAHEKETLKHGSMFFRVGSKRDTSDEGYHRAERCVSLAITSILSPETVTKLLPTLVRAKESAKYVGHEIAPVLKGTLSVSAEILSVTPLPGLEEAAKALLCVWDACQKVDTNRLSCLRLVERCATLLFSVRCEVAEFGEGSLEEPVERLCGALAQIRAFLETQLHRPFLKRYVRREEIAKELQACNDAISDAAARFGMSVQIRTYHQVCSAAYESRRFAQEAQALLSADHQIIAMMLHEHASRAEGIEGFSSENALGLTMDSAPGNNDDVRGGYLAPPPAYGPLLQPSPPTMAGQVLAVSNPTLTEHGSGQNTPTSSELSTRDASDATEATVSAPPTPTPSKTNFATETKTSMTITKQTVTNHPEKLLALELMRVQDAVDAAADEAALRGTLTGALNAHNDVEMVRCLQVARGEVPEAAETLRRMLGAGEAAGVDGMGSEEHDVNMQNTELDRKFMQSGLEAMARLTGLVTDRPQGQVRLGESAGATGAPELPSWTITRYEVIRTCKIGVGFFSDVYLGRWRNCKVVIKVLAHSVSRGAFVRHVELWNALDHPNVLPFYGASSAVGEKPWFFVSKFCGGGNLAAALQHAKESGVIVVVVGENNKEVEVRVDLVRFMHEIAKGMAYLHGIGVLHGDLRAANVLVDDQGCCVLSDFGQCEIKSEAHRSYGKPESHPIRWRAPELLMGDDQPTQAADVYAFAMCCIEILDMGELPWATLDEKDILELVLDKDERPAIPALAGYAEASAAIANLVQSCWAREPDRRPTFARIASSLEEVWRLHVHGSPRASTPPINVGSTPATSTDSSPADERYDTASESMATDLEEENVDGMVDVPLTSPGLALGNGDVACPLVHGNTSLKVSTQMSSVVLEQQDQDTPTPSPTKGLDADMRNEENYRLIVRTNHPFHSSLRLPLWSPTPVELGAVGYLSKPKGEFITLFNAIDPLQSCEDCLRQLPSMYGYGKFEVQKREDGKRNVAQRGLDAISGFLTFKSRGERSHPERIARQYAFPLVTGKPSAYLCVEKTVHRYMDNLEAPMTWFKQHVDPILEVYGQLYALQREDLILVVGTLDAPDWAVFVSDDHSDGRAQFNVFAGREKGEPWGMYTMEHALKSANTGQGRQWVDVGQVTFSRKVSCVTMGGHEVANDTVMLAGLRFEQGMQVPTVM